MSTKALDPGVIEELRKMDAEGKPRQDMCDWLREAHGIDKAPRDLYRMLGAKPGRGRENVERKQTSILLPIEALDRVREIAADLGFTSDRGPIAFQGNISTMLEAIASGELEVRKPSKRARKAA